MSLKDLLQDALVTRGTVLAKPSPIPCKGYQINTWTVDDPDEMRRLIALGVDGIMSNKPDVLRQVVG